MTREAQFDNQNHDDGHFLTIVVIGFLILAANRYSSKFTSFFLAPKNQLAVLLFIVAILLFTGAEIAKKLSKLKEKKRKWESIIKREKDSVYCGVTDRGVEVHLKPFQRAMHTQVVGTTNAGKTESIILPWAIQDINAGRGLLIIDGKSDRAILDKVYAYCVESHREKDFRLFSLSHIDESHQFNPLIGGSPEEIAERAFNAFEIENPYYRAIQYEVLVQFLRIFEELAIVPTFERLYQAVTEPKILQERLEEIGSDRLLKWLNDFIGLQARDRLERTSGLQSALSQFAFGRHADLFRSESPQINMAEALKQGRIVYFQLPVLLAPFLGKATGKLVLQALQSAIGNRHREKDEMRKFFSVFLDDFSEYLYPGFVSILNKSRSAKVGIVFAHQALGDIKTLGDAVSNSILTNSNLKVFMRGSDPETAEYFSRVIGTKTTTKRTERAKRGFVGTQNTGDQSVREVEEFIIHPNRFKSALGVGEAFMVLPHESGSRTEFVKLQMFADLKAVSVPRPVFEVAPPLQATKRQETTVTQGHSPHII